MPYLFAPRHLCRYPPGLLHSELFSKIKEYNSLILLDPRFREDDEGVRGRRRSARMTKMSDCNTPPPFETKYFDVIQDA